MPGLPRCAQSLGTSRRKVGQIQRVFGQRLLDENLDWRLRRVLPGHEVESVPLLGWAGIQNGELLSKAIAAGFDALITMDSNMVHQQNIGHHAIAVIALRAKSNRLDDTSPLMGELLAILPKTKPGTLIFIPES